MKQTILLSLITLLTLFSCSSYVNQMHREFDRADGRKAPRKKDKFSQYRKESPKKSFGQTTNMRENPYVVPAIKRNYRPLAQARVKAKDLTDNSGDGSLWSGVGERNNFLFTLNREKKNGDIVLIQVASKLKNEITNELKRAFPKQIKKKAEPTGATDSTAAATPEVAPAAPANDESDSKEKTYDRISSVVVEEISGDHLLLRGRKNVLFNERKRTVEIQALISRKDIGLDDAVISDKILESNITVLR